MQISLNASFPLSFTCADCGRIVAMIGEHITDKGYYTLVLFPHDTREGDKPVEAVEKGTLSECLYFLSNAALEHEAVTQTLALLYETFGKENVEIVPLFESDEWPEGEQEPYEPDPDESVEDYRTEDDFIQDNFPSMTRH